MVEGEVKTRDTNRGNRCVEIDCVLIQNRAKIAYLILYKNVLCDMPLTNYNVSNI